MAISLKALLQSGQRHQQIGEFAQAEACYRQALSFVPEQPAALFLLGTLAKERGQLADAMSFMRSAIANDPRQARFYMHLGSLLISQFKIEEALALFRSATQHLPTNAEIQDGLGVLLQTKGLAAESLAAYQRAVELNPQLLQAHLHLAVCLIQQGSEEAAIAECRIALQLQPDSVDAHRFLASALIKRGQLGEAIAHLESAQAIDPSHAKIATELTQAHLIAGNATAALAKATEGLAQQKGNTALLTFQYYALCELGRDEEARAILDLDRQISEETFSPLDEYPSLADFHADFKAELLAHPTLTWEPTGKTTRHGYQSGALDEVSLPMTDLFLRHLRKNLDRILANFPTDPSHAFYGNRPADYRLHAWATVLESGGHQEPHFHASGWLSGVYYLEVPPEACTDSQDGWIEFGRPPSIIPLRRSPPVRTIRPTVGKFILFPSCTYHRTLPFEGTGKRISIAFDVMPLDRVVSYVPYVPRVTDAAGLT